ncbi:hypothetical protein V8F33_012118 [Rhypophila sp. PSN 637]
MTTENLDRLGDCLLAGIPTILFRRDFTPQDPRSKPSPWNVRASSLASSLSVAPSAQRLPASCAAAAARLPATVGVSIKKATGPTTQSICREVQKSREKLEREEAALRALPPSPMHPEDVITNGVGRFWDLIETRDYMRARFGAADTLIKAYTWLSVQKALEHMMDMLRLCRGDNMGVRDHIPALMMRLDQQQECYDFLKWWATCDPDGQYDWGDMTLPYLNIRNADPFEPIDPFRSGNLSLSQLSILTLLKLDLSQDLYHCLGRQLGWHSKGRIRSDQPPSNDRVVMLCLEKEEMFDIVYTDLAATMTARCEVERARTPDEAIQALSQAETPSIILIVDAAITRYKRVSERIAACLRAGSTVIVCGCFGAVATFAEFSRFFSRLGLPWTRGGWDQTKTFLCREVVGDELASMLPASYDQKSWFVTGMDRSAMWYTGSKSPSATQAAAVLVKVGNSKLGYIGDVNGEKETTKVVLAMCGLL